MHTGRKYLIAGAAFSLLLLLSAAMTMVSAQRITAEKPKEKEQLPSLTLVYEAERVTAACDGYEWEFMDGSIEVSDARHPYFLLNIAQTVDKSIIMLNNSCCMTI
mgnify:CR=1 FL=1